MFEITDAHRGRPSRSAWRARTGAAATLAAIGSLLLLAGRAPADTAPQMHFDASLSVQSVCFSVTNPSGGQSTLFGQRFTDGPVNQQTPAIVLVHGIASSTEDWDVSPTWSVARALASAGYVVISYDRLGYAQSPYNVPGGGSQLTVSYQRSALHQLVGEVKSGAYSTTSASDCSGARQPSVLQNRTVAIVGHSAGGLIVAGYPGQYHDVAAMVQADISGSQLQSAGPGGSFTNPDPARPDYFQFFTTVAQCRQFDLYAPGVVPYAGDAACSPPFLDSPYGEIGDIGQTYAENDAYISQIGPSIPVLLISGDQDTTDPPTAAKSDLAYYQAHCGCDVSQLILPSTAHLFMVHQSLPAWLSTVENWLSRHGLAAVAAPGAPGGAGRRAPRGVSVRVRRLRSRAHSYRFAVTGRLLLPAGVGGRSACSGGIVAVAVKAGPLTISDRRFALRADCAFSERITFHQPARFGGRRTLRFVVRFGGDAGLGPAATARTVHLASARSPRRAPRRT